MDIFKTYLGRKMKDKNNKQSIKFVDELYQKPKDQTVLDMASRFGYEKRHLCRIFIFICIVKKGHFILYHFQIIPMAKSQYISLFLL